MRPTGPPDLGGTTWSPAGTVGAVALDVHGHVAAATSTGGRAGQPPGRVGDSAIIGAGTWADDATAAISATGDGEAFDTGGFRSPGRLGHAERDRTRRRAGRLSGGREPAARDRGRHRSLPWRAIRGPIRHASDGPRLVQPCGPLRADSADVIRRGRAASAGRPPLATAFSHSDVIRVKERCNGEGLRLPELMAEFGTSEGDVNSSPARRAWAAQPGEHGPTGRGRAATSCTSRSRHLASTWLSRPPAPAWWI